MKTTGKKKTKFHSISMDSYGEHACGVKKNRRSVVCWGSTDDGQDDIPASLS